MWTLLIKLLNIVNNSLSQVVNITNFSCKIYSVVVQRWLITSTVEKPVRA